MNLHRAQEIGTAQSHQPIPAPGAVSGSRWYAAGVLVLLGAAVCLWFLVNHRSLLRPHHNLRLTSLAAVAYAGTARVDLHVSAPHPQDTTFRFRVSRLPHGLSASGTRLRVTSLGATRDTIIRRAHGVANSYTTSVHLAPGRWIIGLTMSSPDSLASHQTRSVRYLLRLSADPSIPSHIQPFLSPLPRKSGGAEGSLALAHSRAMVRVLPAAVGSNTFEIHLSKGARTPKTLQATLVMEDMDMGTTRVTLHAEGQNRYLGHGTFDMGGLWRVTIGTPHAATAAMINVAATPQGAAKAPHNSAYRPPIVSTDFPYAGFVTEMGTNDVAQLNGEITSAGQTPHGVDFLAHQPFIFVTDMGGDAVQIVNIHTGRVVHTVPVGLGPAHVVFTLNGSRAYVTDFLSADVSVVDTRHFRLLRRISVGLNPHGLDITPDGRFVYVACVHGGGVWVISTKSNRVVRTIPTGLEPYGVTMGPASSGRVYVSDFALNQVDVVSLSSGKIEKRIPVGKAPALMVAGPDGNLYVADHGSNAVTVIDMKTDRVVATVPVGAGPHGLDATPDGRYVYVANNNSNTVSIISTRDDQVVETVHVPGRPNEVALQQRDDLHP